MIASDADRRSASRRRPALGGTGGMISPKVIVTGGRPSSARVPGTATRYSPPRPTGNIGVCVNWER